MRDTKQSPRAYCSPDSGHHGADSRPASSSVNSVDAMFFSDHRPEAGGAHHNPNLSEEAFDQNKLILLHEPVSLPKKAIIEGTWPPARADDDYDDDIGDGASTATSMVVGGQLGRYRPKE